MTIEIGGWGIDVAAPQGDAVDWVAVEKIEGCSFAICQVDQTYDRNRREILAKTNLRLGAYLVLHPMRDPIAQARTLVKRAGSMRANDLGYMIDFEVSDGAHGLAILDALERCLAEVERISGRTPIVYTGKYFWAQAVGVDSEAIARYPLMHAQYPRTARDDRRFGDAVRSLPDDPSIAAPWASRGLHEVAWQFDGDGGLRLPSGLDVDVSRWRGSIDEFVSRTTVGEPLNPLLWPDVEACQSALVKLGFHLGVSGPNRDGVDGAIGPQTQGAIEAFENSIGVPVTRAVTVTLGEQLLSALELA